MKTPKKWREQSGVKQVEKRMWPSWTDRLKPFFFQWSNIIWMTTPYTQHTNTPRSAVFHIRKLIRFLSQSNIGLIACTTASTLRLSGPQGEGGARGEARRGRCCWNVSSLELIALWGHCYTHTHPPDTHTDSYTVSKTQRNKTAPGCANSSPL